LKNKEGKMLRPVCFEKTRHAEGDRKTIGVVAFKGHNRKTRENNSQIGKNQRDWGRLLQTYDTGDEKRRRERKRGLFSFHCANQFTLFMVPAKSDKTARGLKCKTRTPNHKKSGGNDHTAPKAKPLKEQEELKRWTDTRLEVIIVEKTGKKGRMGLIEHPASRSHELTCVLTANWGLNII